MADEGTWLERTGVRLRGVGEYLRQHGGTANKNIILESIADLLEPTDDELTMRSDGQPKWRNDVEWQSTNLVKARWLTKDGSGVWTITPDGIEALDKYPDPTEYHAESIRRFNQWKRDRDQNQVRRRAWLIRGSSVLGINMVPTWLAEGFVSLAASQLRELKTPVTAQEIEAFAKEDYAHLKHHELKAKVDEVVAFVSRVAAGDLILTTSEQQIYIGDVSGDWAYAPSEGGRSNLRRPVDWRNQDAPLDFAELPEPLPARLQTGSTVLDLTADLDLIDSLTTPQELVDEPVEGSTPLVPRHERLDAPSAALADELFVDDAWLTEVRDLLNERRQVIFYGPPGTGKTYIARKLAADLVGPEQVKLVQFHPAYTYEDFFEGYRPAAGAAEGTITFELRAGPLRQLVNRAREHPDQAFVLIIDEINRANLAKVFGELYFLLEYRDQAVDLLYSSDDEGFTLPKNLYLIGTMNTADRSIALIDAAMRRRFAFVELSPDSEPTKSLLANWSTHHGLGPTAAALLDRLNRRIEDPDFRIGPSYFMKSTDPDAHSAMRLERIWRTSILPLLQEHHYGEWESVKQHYQLSALLSGVPASEPVAAAVDFASVAADDSGGPAGEDA
jgi:5-methylcytosine-specific restriction protein B